MPNIRSAIKRVRQNARRVSINAPRRSAAKTHVAKAVRIATTAAGGDPAAALREAFSALDRAVKRGAIHANAAARRKSRLALKLNAALGGIAIEPAATKARATGKAAAAKAARARVAASRARAEKGPKTAAGKARAALARTTGAKSAKAAAGSPVRRGTTAAAGREGKAPGARSGRATAKSAPARPRKKAEPGSSATGA